MAHAGSTIIPNSLSDLLAPVAERVQIWSPKKNGWKDVFLLAQVDLWWRKAGPHEECPRVRNAWHKGKHIGLVRGETVVVYSAGECTWMVKHQEEMQKFRTSSPEMAAKWVHILELRVLAWSDMMQALQLHEETKVGQEGCGGTKLLTSANLAIAKLVVDRAATAVGALQSTGAVQSTALLIKEVGGAVPFVGAALQLLGFVLEVAAREREEMGRVGSAHNRLLEVGKRILEGLWEACQQNDKGYVAVLEDLMQFIEKAARALEQFQSKGNICRLKDAFWQTNSGPQSVLQVIDWCVHRLNSFQIDCTHRVVKRVEGDVERVEGNVKRMEGKVDRILQRVRSKSGRLAFIPSAPDVVALDGKVAAVRDKLLKEGRKHVVLHGMGGSGKTTLAKAIVHDDQIRSTFTLIGFVTVAQNPNIEACLKRIYDAFVDAKDRAEFICVADFVTILEAALKDMSVLLVLDDVWQGDVLRCLDVLSMSSRVLITTRDAKVGKCVDATDYCMEPLNSSEAHELFCKCAFDGGKPSRWQEQHVRDIVQECDGLPLALEVIGREVRSYKEGGRRGATSFEKDRWARTVEELTRQGFADSKVVNRVFRLSFNNLDEQERSTLLDLAMLPEDCYARESDLVELQVHSGSCQDEHIARTVLRALADKSLIVRTGEDLMDMAAFQSGDPVNYHMHDVIRDSALKMMDETPLARRNRLVSSHFGDTAFNNITLSSTKFSTSQSINDEQSWSLESLDMPRLQTLLLRDAGIDELPASLLVTQLVVLDLTSSGITKLPPQIASLQSAKLLRVDYCYRLGCLPNEVGALSKLQVLSMRGCRSIYDLPNSIWGLSNLTKFLLPHCGILHLFPAGLPTVHSLSALDLSRSYGLRQLPPSFGDLSSLKALNLGGCWQLTHLPTSLGRLQHLEMLILHGCDSLMEISDSVTLLSNLEELDAQKCIRVARLPGGIADGCPKLRVLRLQGSQLGFPAFAKQLESLEIIGLPESCEIPVAFSQQFPNVEVESEPTMECRETCQMYKDTPLHWAAGHGLMDMLELSSREIEVDMLDEFGSTPLYYAAAGGHTAAAGMLLDRRASIEGVDKDGQTPLNCAAGMGHTATAEMFLDRGASIDGVDVDEQTPLHHAAQGGCAETAEMLLVRGASIERLDKYGMTPLHYAAEEGHTATAEMLLDRGASIEGIEVFSSTPLHCAAAEGHTATAKMLLDRSASIDAADKCGNTPLHCAAYRGHIATAELLLDLRACIEAIDEDGQTPLHHAAQGCCPAAAEMLLARGALLEGVDEVGRQALHFAAAEGRTATVEILLDQGALIDCVDNQGMTSLHYAAAEGHTAAAEMLLDRGASTEKADEDGLTPLHYAAGTDQKATAEMLLERGALIDAVGADSHMPLHYASEMDNTATAEMLLDRGASIEGADKDGQTPLHHAAQAGCAATAEMLLARGAMLEAGDEEGRTALSWAAECSAEVAMLLLKHGADPCIADKNGRRPSHWARAPMHGEGDSDLADLLEKSETL